MKLKSRRVLIAGIGGLGTSSAELLASIGVGHLRLVDYDVIELSNLPRQKLFHEKDIGKSKAEVAAERLLLRNPNMSIEYETMKIDPLSAPILLEDVDLVIDGLDKFSSRKGLYRVAHSLNIPYIFAGAVAEQGNVMSFQYGETEPCLYCVVGGAGDDNQATCEILGVHPAILSLITSIQVTEAVKILLNQQSDLNGEMIYIDLLGLTFDKVKIKKNPDCSFCGNTRSDELDSGKTGEITKGIREIGSFGSALVTSLCGRDTKIIDPNWDIDWEFKQVKEKLSKYYHFAVSGNKYVTFNTEGVGISLLNSGIATIRGSKTTTRAIEMYTQVYKLIQS